MIAIVCVDDSYGILFHNRRVSRDRVLNEWIRNLTKGKTLWMRAYSKELFLDAPNRSICSDYLDQAKEGEYCFVEDDGLLSHIDHVEAVILCRWNRCYPSDVKLPDLLEYKLPAKSVLTEFAGSSHDKITIEEWKK